MKKGNKTYNSLLIGGFILILLTPWVFEYLPYQSESLDNKVLKEKPVLGEEDYLMKLDAYYKDNYGLRNNFIALGGYMRTQVFQSSPKPKIVVYGKDNWLFYNEIGDQIFNSYSNRNTLSKDELKAFYQDYLWIKEVCEKHGVQQYYKIVWPNKHTIYSEYLSGRMSVQQLNPKSKREQLVELFASKDSIRFIDPHNYLIQKKEEGQLYHKFDTHWNLLGAFYGYQYVMNSLNSILDEKPRMLNEFDLVFQKNNKGDLIKLMGLDAWSINEEMPSLNYKSKLDTSIYQYDKNNIGINDFRNNSLKNGKTLLIFGDSYTEKIQWLFLFHFEKVIFVKSGFSEEMLQVFQPDIVFEAKVERYL